MGGGGGTNVLLPSKLVSPALYRVNTDSLWHTNWKGVASKVAWPSGLRRWFKAPVSSEAWVRIPPLPKTLFSRVSFWP